jgi:hypothetical protein
MDACRRVDVRDPSVMRYGQLGAVNWADRLAILTLDACRLAILTLDGCHVQTSRQPTDV